MSRTHDITISAFDLDRLEAELKQAQEALKWCVAWMDTLTDLPGGLPKECLEELDTVRRKNSVLDEAWNDVGWLKK